ncbi:uncharacterized protein LOC130733662 [Lotus japonicus]|uniref:uncharacterized protein LOC130733662 n=1 Tax=Lotus japonicus TaxID=34305 RepID=UPI00258A3ED8|nr:uncharacterized protein LOC130733662 [Lotus japonicus]
MDTKKKQAGDSSSSTMNFDHLFGPKDSSTTSSSSASLFGSMFSPPPPVGRRESRTQVVGGRNFSAPGTHSSNTNKGESNSRIICKNYQNEMVEAQPSYFSSSIYYGGQENYSPRTTQPHQHVFKKDKEDGDPNGNDSSSASRGNWWEGSLYY